MTKPRRFSPQTSYTFPSPTGSVTTALQPSGDIAGTIAINQTLCGDSTCSWFPVLTEQPGDSICPVAPGSDVLWVGPTEGGIGSWSWPYDFTPDTSMGTINLCLNVYYQDLGSYRLVGEGHYTFPPPISPPLALPPTASPSQRPPLPRLTGDATKGYVAQAIRRKLGKPLRSTEHCRRASNTQMNCRVAFTERQRTHWTGTVVIWLTRAKDTGVEWDYSLKLTGRPPSCKTRACTKRIAVR